MLLLLLSSSSSSLLFFLSLDFFKPIYYGLLLFHFCNDWLTGWLAGWLAGWLTDWLTAWMNEWMKRITVTEPSNALRNAAELQDVLVTTYGSKKSIPPVLILSTEGGFSKISLQPFHDGGRYHIEISPLICSANQWTGFYMITASVMKGLNEILRHIFFDSFFLK